MKSVLHARVVRQSLALCELQHQQQTSEDCPPQLQANRTVTSTDHQTVRFTQNKCSSRKKLLFSHHNKSSTDHQHHTHTQTSDVKNINLSLNSIKLFNC